MQHPAYRFLFLFFICFPLISTCLTACRQSETPKKVQSLDFTVVTGSDIPKELRTLIKERKKNAFELTYSDNSYLYVIKGYGAQQTGGYNISIKEFYQSDDCLVFDTELSGPKKDQTVSQKTTYPYIVIKTEYREDPVVFR